MIYFEKNIKFDERVKFDKNIKIEKNVKFDENIKVEKDVKFQSYPLPTPPPPPPPILWICYLIFLDRKEILVNQEGTDLTLE